MRSVRRVGAFFSGLLLYSSVMGISSFLARLQLPGKIYASLGGRNSMVSVILEALIIAMLAALLSLAWGYITVVPRGPLRRGHRPTTSWCVAGVTVGWLAWTIYGAIYFSLNPRSYGQPLYALLLSSSVPPLWGVLNGVAVLAAVLLAGHWATRSRDAALGPVRRSARRDGTMTSM